MNGGAAAGAGAGSAAAVGAVIAQAIKASGAIIRVDSHAFEAILERQEAPLIVRSQGGWLRPNYQYLTSHKGLIFFLKADQPLVLPVDSEVIEAKKIWIPQ